ncbi:TraE DNA topoisomeraseIII [Novosphingobium sp. Rr 2-17]|nr:TraE DNA topoisomeraseIII [Novosphingobium sp. Rr 2-17]
MVEPDMGLVRRPSAKKKNSFWWSCSGYPDCKQTNFDVNGKPNYSTREKTA